MSPSSDRQRSPLVLPTVGFVSGLLLMGVLRWFGEQGEAPSALSGVVTLGYVLMTVAVMTTFVRRGLPLQRYGFARPDLRQLAIFIAAVAAMLLVSAGLDPALEQMMGSSRNLDRFSGVEGSRSSLWALLLFSWTFAAFGEELVFRILLLRALAFLLGDTRTGSALAVLGQAVVFGLVHAYQGPVGVTETFVDGLVLGTATVAARWSIWPSALAHGSMNTWGIVRLYQS